MKKFITAFVLSVLIIPAVSLAAFSQNLSYRASDQEVTDLQNFLTKEGLYTGPITGNFYTLTKNALIAFQKQNGIQPASGFFGPVTRAIVNKIADNQILASSVVTPQTSTPPANAIILSTASDSIFPSGCISNLGYSTTTGLSCQTINIIQSTPSPVVSFNQTSQNIPLVQIPQPQNAPTPVVAPPPQPAPRPSHLTLLEALNIFGSSNLSVDQGTNIKIGSFLLQQKDSLSPDQYFRFCNCNLTPNSTVVKGITARMIGSIPFSAISNFRLTLVSPSGGEPTLATAPNLDTNGNIIFSPINIPLSSEQPTAMINVYADINLCNSAPDLCSPRSVLIQIPEIQTDTAAVDTQGMVYTFNDSTWNASVTGPNITVNNSSD